MIEKHNFLSTMTTNNPTEEGSEQEQMQVLLIWEDRFVRVCNPFINMSLHSKLAIDCVIIFDAGMLIIYI